MIARDILLCTLNARYMHTAFGLRYLYANLGDLQPRAALCEFTLQESPLNIAEQLLAHRPKIIGFSVYIWNVRETSETVELLKTLAPDVKIVLGGPEVSHYPDVPELCTLADFVIAGPGERTFPELCRQLLSGYLPPERFLQGESVPLDTLVMPYAFYSDEDIRNRLIYVEASRGCPFKCEFCLSSLDKTATAFPLSHFLDEMDRLWRRGVRNFKFIDRTFNLRLDTSIAILEFFLARMCDELYLHFEVIPDNLPARLRDVLRRFPPQSLQFEIGVQSFDPDIQARISRRQSNDKTRQNIRWLREHTGAHLHTDLIFGLPGDSLENFAHSFDMLVSLGPQEIQLGILKRLRGAPLNRHNGPFDLRYNPQPPYNILSSRDIDFSTMQRVNRFARFWDLVGNSGRFGHTLPLILDAAPFQRFMLVSDRLYQLSGRTANIALKRLFELLYIVMTGDLALPEEQARTALDSDYTRTGLKGRPDYSAAPRRPARSGSANRRQRHHV